jgi:hypothetical protein
LCGYITNLQKDITYLEKNIEKKKASISTNDRKAYYENEEIKREDWWLIVIYIVYGILIVIAIVHLATTPIANTTVPKLFNPSVIIILIVLIVYPFVVLPISKGINESIKHMKKNIPKDVYLPTHEESHDYGQKS